MEYEKLKDSLDGLFAYDMGATDSGIHDEMLRAEIKNHLSTLSQTDKKALVDRIVSEFGWEEEDREEFIKWLENEMDCPIAEEDDEDE